MAQCNPDRADYAHSEVDLYPLFVYGGGIPVDGWVGWKE